MDQVPLAPISQSCRALLVSVGQGVIVNQQFCQITPQVGLIRSHPSIICFPSDLIRFCQSNAQKTLCFYYVSQIAKIIEFLYMLNFFSLNYPFMSFACGFSY